ncbi:MAG: SDR family oxidoreductase [Planctomycetota bacterium]
MSKRRLIFGCGYLGKRVADAWRDAGDEVFAVTRSEERAAAWRAEGLHPILADVTDPATLAELPTADTVLFAVGYDRNAGPSIFEVYEHGFQNALDALPRGTGRVVYISTTGVYGDAGGDWVDEQTPPDPKRDGGRASLAAERALADHHNAADSVVLRLAGIYGPGRVPFLERLKSGQPINAPSEGWLNLIHVEDAARIVQTVADAEQTAAVYCVSDGNPVVRGEYYAEAARLLGVAPPEFEKPPEGSSAAARAGASKRISNRRLQEDLGVRFAYPTHRAGLAAIISTSP